MMIGLLLFGMDKDLKWPEHLGVIGIWIAAIILFSIIYIIRARWLEDKGIYDSWSSFRAHMMEHHIYPEVMNIQKEEFLKWASLPEERTEKLMREVNNPSYFGGDIKQIYNRINDEIKFEPKRKMYIRCLAWYCTGFPLEDNIYEYEED